MAEGRQLAAGLVGRMKLLPVRSLKTLADSLDDVKFGRQPYPLDPLLVVLAAVDEYETACGQFTQTPVGI
jgi:hypothetical protein